MKLIKTIFKFVVIIMISYYMHKIYVFIKPIPIPDLENVWWGPGEQQETEDLMPHVFEINVTQEEINDLYLRLKISRPFTKPLEGTEKHQYGFNPILLSEILDYLKNNYSFKEREDFLNKYPQYSIQIQGLNIHFIHIKPEVPKNITIFPLLMLHGWPSSVREYYEMIPLLIHPQRENNFVFEVIIPSLPGFGYSDGSAKPGCQAPHIAVIFNNLMRILGHHTFYVHGSDLGAIIATNLATLYPRQVLGMHSNFCVSLRYISIIKMILANTYPPLIMPKGYEHKFYPLLNTFLYYLEESGYLHIQATKPDTIGPGLDNSLEGLISFTFDILSGGIRKNDAIGEDGKFLKKYDFTFLLDNLIFYYWLPKAATTAARIYSENFNFKAFELGINNIPIDSRVPCGCAFFKNEFLYQPDIILRDKYTNLIQYNHFDKGGHFSAWDQSELLAKDIIDFVYKTRHKYI